ncbi:hypothetical protein E2C01_099328 [Portunus trituberculatus]|uniref:Uncharacterized protein n=1 Tax=Portunus trituberculatus TaxID=210409 RepID=A0A5B7K3K1_PORTR|nr:hypothetical protein [Portunus trituberculatus]
MLILSYIVVEIIHDLLLGGVWEECVTFHSLQEPQSTSGSESEDEPVSKLRRLSTSSASCGSTSGSSCPPSPRPAARHYTRRARTLRWSAADDSSLSEAGSYIEVSLEPRGDVPFTLS